MEIMCELNSLCVCACLSVGGELFLGECMAAQLCERQRVCSCLCVCVSVCIIGQTWFVYFSPGEVSYWTDLCSVTTVESEAI